PGAAAPGATAMAPALSPTRQTLYRDPEVVRGHPAMPRLEALALAGRPPPVTPYYLLLSATVQPEFSAALVGVKRPERAIADAGKRLGYFLQGPRWTAAPRAAATGGSLR